MSIPNIGNIPKDVARQLITKGFAELKTIGAQLDYIAQVCNTLGDKVRGAEMVNLSTDAIIEFLQLKNNLHAELLPLLDERLSNRLPFDLALALSTIDPTLQVFMWGNVRTRPQASHLSLVMGAIIANPKLVPERFRLKVNASD